MIDIASIDHYVSQHSRFCLIDWLLADNYLYYSDFEAWRCGLRKTLDKVFQFDTKDLQGLIDKTELYCADLGLVAHAQEFYSWDADQPIALIACENNRHNQHLMQCWLRPKDQSQLDLFMDNSAQIAEFKLREALSARQFVSAQQTLRELSALNPACGRLDSYQELVSYGLHQLENPHIDQHALGNELQRLNQKVRPQAQEVLGHFARDYLAQAWRRLAGNMQGLPFDPATPDCHISSVLSEIPDHMALLDCIKTEPQGYLQPILLERMALAYEALHQQEMALIVWCLLFELDVEFAERTINLHQSQKIHALWQDFWEVGADLSAELFPAYVLITKSALIHRLERFPPLHSQASQAACLLLQKRLNKEDEIPARAALQAISPALLAVYLTLPLSRNRVAHLANCQWKAQKYSPS